MRLLEKHLKKCEGCGQSIYQLESTKLWYDLRHHDFVCEGPNKIHGPKKAGTD